MVNSSCFDTERSRFIEKCNIEEMKGKRNYLKIIIDHYSSNGIKTIPKLCVCQGSDECIELLSDTNLKHAIKLAKKSKNGPAEAKKVENYIQYPIFMGFLRIEILKGNKWVQMLTDDYKGLIPEITSENSFFRGNDEHVRYPYIVMVMLMIHKLKRSNYSERRIVDYLNSNNIVVFSAKNRNKKTWDIEELIKQSKNKKRIDQLNKADELKNYSIDDLVSKIHDMLSL